MNTVYKQINESQGAKVGCIISSVIVGGIFLTATVYLGIYAYNNPDPNSCWVIRELDTSFRTKEEVIQRAQIVDIEIPEGYPMEMHKLWIAWFTWGFWSKIILILLTIFSYSISYASTNIATVLGAISYGLYITNGLVWLAMGAVWRFSDPGMIAAGEKLARKSSQSDQDWNKAVTEAVELNGYQRKSGLFAKIYILLMVWIIVLTLIGFSVSCFVLCLCDPRSDKQGENEEEEEDSSDEENDKKKRNLGLNSRGGQSRMNH